MWSPLGSGEASRLWPAHPRPAGSRGRRSPEDHPARVGPCPYPPGGDRRDHGRVPTPLVVTEESRRSRVATALLLVALAEGALAAVAGTASGAGLGAAGRPPRRHQHPHRRGARALRLADRPPTASEPGRLVPAVGRRRLGVDRSRSGDPRVGGQPGAAGRRRGAGAGHRGEPRRMGLGPVDPRPPRAALASRTGDCSVEGGGRSSVSPSPTGCWSRWPACSTRAAGWPATSVSPRRCAGSTRSPAPVCSRCGPPA